ncbi:hypothetical protein CLAFUW4_14043 [Fulvia fulva]|uniref:Uncharacterized protein n=1 Tax=Passalora fulva TaxID=5499 RepID=A0A9Q8PLK5_PASFU|nr:uncharacterized protein CLAFUR5_13881 [Fulvia fulva]KAK4610714.1 hypothetical protein CLAFUR4_14046 [Fulvia fulva]KAK4611368.1 hypothetical protein CLAFUR0_14050 [Fulvia fulva]UJO24622.1 hypothetical protein CLAFUR5_13881 [Fulvia fulva]WPV21993.1 hypothetical protein CLAFUW4_14043 [Fulvia fulva]WPV36644.1 hypothetical protein CLAFUW7_14054 [Fulvia fulva]
MSPPANAAAVAKVLADIDADPGKIASRSQQDSFLKNMTSKYKFRYYSSTYGHTCHDEKSLRSVLVAIMRHHGKDGEDIRPGKSAVDELFERGSGMLDDDYLKAMTEAAEGIELEVDSDSDDSEEESEIDQELIDFIEAQTDSDDEYTPNLAGRTRSANKKRRLSATVQDARQHQKTSLIESWIESCSTENSGRHTSTLNDDQNAGTLGSSSGTSSIAVAKRRKTGLSSIHHRTSKAQTHTQTIKHVATKSSKPTDAPEFLGLNENTDTLDTATRKATLRGTRDDGLLHIKLLAVAAIAALL